MAGIPAFQHTAIEAIPGIIERARQTFYSNKTKPIEYRLVQLRKLYWGLKDNEEALVEAMRLDLGKPRFESFLTEVNWVQNDIIYICNNLAKWTKDEKAPDIPLSYAVVGAKIRREPLGLALVIGAFNFPVNLALCPFVGAMAAGCTAILKPSEGAPNTAAVMQKIIEQYLDNSAYGVVQGAVPETTALLNEKWDKIFYTGNATVGTIVAKKAAETLTPVTLELGGLNPAIITKNADLKLAARRLLWGKTLNAGQVCLSHNYTLVEKDTLAPFVQHIKSAIKEFYPNGVKESPDFGRIASDRHFQRLKRMLDNSHGKILIGGKMDEKEKFIEPTVVQVDDVKDSLMTEESFGPLLPIYPVNSVDEALRVVSEIQRTPLALYAFGSKAETDRILFETTSGGASVNDSFMHGSIYSLGFGGVGESGNGSYRGKGSFDSFTHKRSITSTPLWVEALIKIRYPPYAGNIPKFQRMSLLKPNFDREGRATGGLLGWILRLGGASRKSALGRYVLVLIAAVGLRQYLANASKL